jgi:uncharacterized protein YaiI (UPF0178 family)
MGIWVDADACPKAIRDILIRAAGRREETVCFVANQWLDLPRGRFVSQRRVGAGFDAADQEIVRQLEPGDLVITQDIPLAADALERRAEAISPRGEVFSPDTIAERLTMRDLLDTLRGSGMVSGGPPPLSALDRQQFANALDRYLTRRAADGH